jgi:trimeric autotransporter adhesin
MRIDRRTSFVLTCSVLALAASLTLSCSAAPVENSQETVAAVIVSPERMTLQMGRRERFEATVLDLDGAPTNGVHVFWAVEDTSIARINAAGEVEARGLGTTKIAASAEGRSDIADLTVIPRQVASVALSPASAQLPVGSTLQLQPTARDEWGDVIPGRSFTWSTSSSARATVSSSGVVTGRAPGAVTISATTGGISGTSSVAVLLAPVATVTVEPADLAMFRSQQVQLVARLRDAAGNELSGRTVTWSTSNDRTVSVSSTGVVTAHRRGSATITARSEGVSGTAHINVIL